MSSPHTANNLESSSDKSDGNIKNISENENTTSLMWKYILSLEEEMNRLKEQVQNNSEEIALLGKDKEELP